MRGQAGFWDIDERYVRLSDAGDPLEKLNAVAPWKVFRKPLAKALKRADGCSLRSVTLLGEGNRGSFSLRLTEAKPWTRKLDYA